MIRDAKPVGHRGQRRVNDAECANVHERMPAKRFQPTSIHLPVSSLQNGGSIRRSSRCVRTLSRTSWNEQRRDQSHDTEAHHDD